MKTRGLSDADVRRELLEVCAKERVTVAEVVARIAEFDARALYREEACSSMFVYCVERLHFSEDATCRRIRVARLSRQFPIVLEYLASGKIHLTALSLLAPHLTEENHREVLERAVFRNKKHIEELCAELSPKPDLLPMVRALPNQTRKELVLEPVANEARKVSVPERIAKPARVAPLAPERFAVQFTADKALKAKLDRAKELLPGTDLAEVVSRALTLLVDNIERTRFARCEKPRKTEGESSTRRVPNAIKRAVYERDQGQCTFEDNAGHRCTNRAVEYDHVEPYARGGQTTFDNLRLRCRTHNLLAAEETFGKSFMRAKRDRDDHAPP